MKRIEGQSSVTLAGIADGVVPYDFWMAVSKGVVPGHSALLKYGRNDDIDQASGYEALWNGGGDYTGFDATGAEICEIVSSSAQDAAGGTGAQEITVYGLSGAGVAQSETVTLTGLAAAETTLTYWRCPRAKCGAVGSGGRNAGAITISQKTSGVVFAVVPALYGTTMIAAYTIPAATTAYLVDWYVTLAGRTSADIIAQITRRSGAGQSWQVMEEVAARSAGTSAINRKFLMPKTGLTALSDIYIAADTDANNTSVAGAFALVLVQDGY